MRYFASTGGRMPAATLERLRAIFPQAPPVPDVRADRGLPLHLPRSRARSTLARTRSARRSRTPRSSSSARTVRSATPARSASWCTAAPWSRWATGTIPSAPRRGSSPRPDPEPAVPRDRARGLLRRPRHGATRRASSISSAASDEMIKTSGYRVSPTEIEQVAYATGSGRRRGGPRHRRRAARPADRARGAARPTARLEPDELLAALRRELPLYMVPASIVVRPPDPPLAQQQARPQPRSRGARRHDD